MQQFKIFLAIALSLSLMACQSLPSLFALGSSSTNTQSNGWSANSKHDNGAEKIAELARFEIAQGFITITAVSEGCTFFNSFAVRSSDSQQNAIKVVRLKPDLCRMSKRTVDLQYSFKHLGLDLTKTVKVINPVRQSSSMPLSASVD